jgi:hypothetical protein
LAGIGFRQAAAIHPRVKTYPDLMLNFIISLSMRGFLRVILQDEGGNDCQNRQADKTDSLLAGVLKNCRYVSLHTASSIPDISDS